MRRQAQSGHRGAILVALAFAGCAGPSRQVATSIQTLDPPALDGAMAPQLTAAGADLWLSWIEPGRQGSHRLRASRWRDGVWGAPLTVAEEADMMANWADVPSVIALPGGGLAAHWLRLAPGGDENYGVRIAASNDAGRTWTELGSPHRDEGPGEHGFLSAVGEPSVTRLFWLDGRGLAQSPHGGAMQLRTALLTAGAIGLEEVVDADVCTCCPTSAVMGAEGPVVFYRDHEPGEIRDIAVIRKVGSGWSEPVLVHADGWEVPGCPVNGPSASASTDGRTIVVAWFTAAGNQPRVRAAFSEDAGAAFGPPLEIDADRPLGRAAALMTGDGEAVVAWIASSSGGGADLLVRRIASGGRMSAAIKLARVAQGRSSGFPRLARAGDAFLASWTDASTPSRLHAALIPSEAVPPVR